MIPRNALLRDIEIFPVPDLHEAVQRFAAIAQSGRENKAKLAELVGLAEGARETIRSCICEGMGTAEHEVQVICAPLSQPEEELLAGIPPESLTDHAFSQWRDVLFVATATGETAYGYSWTEPVLPRSGAGLLAWFPALSSALLAQELCYEIEGEARIEGEVFIRLDGLDPYTSAWQSARLHLNLILKTSDRAWNDFYDFLQLHNQLILDRESRAAGWTEQMIAEGQRAVFGPKVPSFEDSFRACLETLAYRVRPGEYTRRLRRLSLPLTSGKVHTLMSALGFTEEQRSLVLKEWFAQDGDQGNAVFIEQPATAQWKEEAVLTPGRLSAVWEQKEIRVFDRSEMEAALMIHQLGDEGRCAGGNGPELVDVQQFQNVLASVQSGCQALDGHDAEWDAIVEEVLRLAHDFAAERDRQA